MRASNATPHGRGVETPARGLSCRAAVLCAWVCFIAGQAVHATALDDYVATPDAEYSFVQVGPGSYDDSTYTTSFVLELTSQSWREASEVDHTVWRHWIRVIVPASGLFMPPVKDTALLVIGGGDHDDPAPGIDPGLRLLAGASRAVVAELTAVPNQPLLFADQAAALREDEIIAYSWDKFLRTGEATWPVQLPMVKSVVRAMDAVKAFVASSAGGRQTVRGFILTGASKRGWTAWLTAAVDSRVRAVVPIVSNLLNMRLTFAHQLGSYGYRPSTLSPYEDFGIFDWLDSPEGEALLEIVDPFRYRDRLTMPKFIVNATGDDFFIPDSDQFYLRGLPGETLVRQVPNTDHYLTGVADQVLRGMAPYVYAILNGYRRPRFSWSLRADGAIQVNTIDAPRQVLLWQASNADARDFRLTSIGSAWQSSALANQGGGLYVGYVAEPPVGWTAFFIELVYDNPFHNEYGSYGEFYYHLTTEVRVRPSVLPFPQAMLAPVHRFWSPTTGKHFYTIDPAEKQKLTTDWADMWTYEGQRYHAYLTDCDWGLKAVHRFWSAKLSAHFYTIDEQERQKLIDDYWRVWTHEGAVFYAWPEGEQPAGSVPVHRFWSASLGAHFYTTSEAEKTKLIDSYRRVWTYEGIAWYVRNADD